MSTVALAIVTLFLQVPAGAQDEIAETFVAYEKIRSLLADDKTEGVSKEAERLAKVADRAADRSGEALKEHLKAASRTAGALKEAKDLPASRLAFGELSRHIVGVLHAEPTLRRGRYVYKCPMVKEGYALWVQTAKEVSNPYMGKKMLRCGELPEKEDEAK